MTAVGKTMAGDGGLSRLAATYADITRFFGEALVPVFDLFLRLWIAKVFFFSGLTKLDSWDSTLFLFEMEYAVPVLPTALTAILATAFELLMPVLLAIGLASRFAALPLLAMAMVIQFVLGARSEAFDHITHFYWMILLVNIVLRGPGKLSVDHWIARRFGRA